MKRTLALILSLVMCLGLLAGCGDKKTDDGQTDGKTLVVGTQNFDGKFSPFFYTNDYENQVMGMVFDGLFLVDREGSVVLKGIEGDVRPYNGTDYTYKGIADCDIVENSDGTVDYNITLKEGVKFSDGEEMTIDDVIFSYYVLLDPAYDGVSTLYSLPIKGLEAYRSGMETVQNLILAAGPDAYAANDFYTEEQYNAYWAAFNAAGYGVLWGVGGLTFGLSMRYLGVALGQSIALGTCAGFGTLFPAIFAGENLFAGKGLVLLLGVSITLAGIAVIGYAGSLRSQNMTDEEKRAAVKDFALTKGLAVALLAGVMSACFNLGLEAGRPLQVEGGSALFRTLPATLMVTLGGFVTNAAYCLWQNARNRTFGDYGKGTLYANNLLFCALAGALWYSQFFGFGIGQTFFEPGSVVAAFAWCILMALNVTFSNVWGIILREWRGASRKTVGVLVCGLAILIFSLVFPNLF